MALKQCPECKREISGTAKRCPHCGFKKPPALSPLFAIFLILVACLIAAVAIWITIAVQQADRAYAKFKKTAGIAEAYYRYLSPAPRRTLARPTPTQLNTSPPIVAPAVSGTKPPFVTLRQAVLVQLPYGTVTLPVGTRLEFVSSDSSEVHVRYNNTEQAVPITAVDVK